MKTKQLAILLAATLGAWSSKAAAEPPTGESSPLRRAGWYTVGGGVAALGASGVFFVLASSDRSDMHQRGAGEAADDFDRNLTTAKILAVAGAVSVATGVTLILVAPKDHKVALTAGPGQFTLSGTF